MGDERSWTGLALERDGQSTVEYALLVAVSLAMLAALAALWHAGSDGGLVQGVVSAASHVVDGAITLGTLQDVLLF